MLPGASPDTKTPQKVSIDRSEALPQGCRAVTGPGLLPSQNTHLRENELVFFSTVMSLTQAEVLIALVVAAHAGVLAVRLAASLYRA